MVMKKMTNKVSSARDHANVAIKKKPLNKRKKVVQSEAESESEAESVGGKWSHQESDHIGRILSEKALHFNDEQDATMTPSEEMDNDRDWKAQEQEYEQEFETSQKKKLQQAKAYIQELEDNLDYDEVDAADIDRELIADRLQKDALSAQGRLFVSLADKFHGLESHCVATFLKYHNKPVTCAVFSPDSKFIYSTCKDGKIQQWNTVEKKKGLSFVLPTTPLGSRTAMDKRRRNIVSFPVFYTLAVCPNHEYLVAGGRDRLIHVWRIQDGSYVKALKHHRDVVTGLVFRQPGLAVDAGDTGTLFSCSQDRTVKVWNVEGFAYTDTLFGHEDAVLGMDALARDRCLTVGARDRTARLWKIAEASQLVFKVEDKEGSLDSVALMDEEHFITGSESGTLSVWQIGKKRAMTELKEAHGPAQAISSIAVLKYTDLFATGSSDGFIRLWKVGSDFKSIAALTCFPISGWINHLSFNGTTTPSDIALVASVGQEPRLGRWQVVKKAKNVVCHMTWTKPTTH